MSEEVETFETLRDKYYSFCDVEKLFSRYSEEANENKKIDTSGMLIAATDYIVALETRLAELQAIIEEANRKAADDALGHEIADNLYDLCNTYNDEIVRLKARNAALEKAIRDCRNCIYSEGGDECSCEVVHKQKTIATCKYFAFDEKRFSDVGLACLEMKPEKEARLKRFGEKIQNLDRASRPTDGSEL